LVGIHDSYLYDTPREQRPLNVLFVHVDKGEIVFEEDPYELGVTSRLFTPNAQIPKSKVEKLRGKLQEFGGCIYRKDMQWVKAGYPFPHNEHLVPLKSEPGQGSGSGGSGTAGQHTGGDVLTHTGVGGLFSTQQLASSLTKLGIRRASTATPAPAAATATAAANTAAAAGSGASAVSLSPASSKSPAAAALSLSSATALSGYEAVPYRHPAACTLVLASTKPSSSSSSNTHNASSHIHKLFGHSAATPSLSPSPSTALSVSLSDAHYKDLLDPENNYEGQESLSPGHFNAKEIREAFFRFFVASFSDYQSFLKTPSPAPTAAAAATTVDGPAGSGERGEEELFDSDAFIASLQDDFLAQV
jgi:hypothetical protein